MIALGADLCPYTAAVLGIILQTPDFQQLIYNAIDHIVGKIDHACFGGIG